MSCVSQGCGELSRWGPLGEPRRATLLVRAVDGILGTHSLRIPADRRATGATGNRAAQCRRRNAPCLLLVPATDDSRPAGRRRAPYPPGQHLPPWPDRPPAELEPL